MRSLVVSLLAGLAAACATAGDDHAYEARSADGYSEERLDEQRWRIEYVGASYDAEDAVEQNLLRRAAELTVQSGYDWFAPADASLTEAPEIVVEARASQADRTAVWRPRWRRRDAHWWTDWDPRGAEVEPQAPPQSRGETRYAAVAEIVMGRGPAPEGAFSAAAIVR
jgi:hypothetical protein